MSKFKGEYWNTRIIRQHIVYHFKNGYVGDEYIFGIHEVYYDKNNKPIAWTENPIRVYFENENWLNRTLEQIEDARKRTVLELETIDGEDGDIVDSCKTLDMYEKVEEEQI